MPDDFYRWIGQSGFARGGPDDVIKIRIGGKEYQRWKSLSFQKSLGTLAGILQMDFMEKYRSAQAILWDLHIGAYITLKVNDYPIMKGWIDGIEEDWGPDSHDLRLIAREVTGDLVDCAHLGNKEWFSTDLYTIAAEVCAPFNIEVKGDPYIATQAEGWGKKFAHIVYNEGDTVFAFLDRLAKSRGILLLYAYNYDPESKEFGKGQLWLTNAGDQRSQDAIIHGIQDHFKGSWHWRSIGHNAKAGRHRNNNLDRFSRIICKGQSMGDSMNIFADAGFDVEGFKTFTEAYGEAEDSAIKRYRPTVILGAAGGNVDLMQDLAYWEAMNRAGMSRVHEYDLAGWTERTGKPWELNTLVPVQDKTNGVTGDFLIDGLVFNSDKDSGNQSTIRLVNPSTYKQPWEVQEDDPGQILGVFDQLFAEENE